MSIYKLSLIDKSSNNVYFKTSSDLVLDEASGKTLDKLLGTYAASNVGDGTLFGIIGGQAFGSGYPSTITESINKLFKWMPINAKSIGVLSNCLLIDSATPFSDNNSNGLVVSGSTSGIPTDCSYGIRNIQFYSASSIFCLIIGYNTSNKPMIWINMYNGSSWIGWSSFITSSNISSQSVNYATTSGSCTGNAATATSANTAANCTGNSATATTAANGINRVLFGSGNSTLNNIRFVIGQADIAVSSKDGTFGYYYASVDYSQFTNFHNNTIACIPVGCYNTAYGTMKGNVSSEPPYVTVIAQASGTYRTTVLFIEYNV